MSIENNADALMAIHPQGESITGIAISTKSKHFVDNQGIPYDYVSRNFVPWIGIREDAASGY